MIKVPLRALPLVESSSMCWANNCMLGRPRWTFDLSTVAGFVFLNILGDRFPPAGSPDEAFPVIDSSNLALLFPDVSIFTGSSPPLFLIKNDDLPALSYERWWRSFLRLVLIHEDGFAKGLKFSDSLGRLFPECFELSHKLFRFHCFLFFHYNNSNTY